MENRTIFEKTELFLMKTDRFSFFFVIFQHFHFTKFSRMRYFKNFNSVFTKNLEIDSSFFRIFYFKFLKKINLTDQFLINRSPPVVSVFIEITIHACGSEFSIFSPFFGAGDLVLWISLDRIPFE
jgi:hypothetical protein